MRTTVRALRAIPLLALCITAAAGCSSGSKKATATTSAPPTSTASTPASTSTSAVSTPPKTSAKPTPKATLGRCEDVLPIADVDRAVGHPVVGGTAFIVNQPDATIGQLARINCQYGLRAAARTTAPVPARPAGSSTTKSTPAVPAPAATGPAQVEVSVSEYAAAKQATARISATSDEWRAHAAVPHAVKVGAHPATVLTGYGPPLLVLASGTHTVAVNVLASVVPAARLDSVLSGIAAAALSGAGG